MWETWVQSLGWEDALEEGMATHTSILAWRIPMNRSLAGHRPWGHKGLDVTERLSTHSTHGFSDENLLYSDFLGQLFFFFFLRLILLT